MISKKGVLSFLLGLTTFTSCIGPCVQGAQAETFDLSQAVVLITGEAKALVKGERTEIDPENEAVMPIILDDRTLIPADFTANAFGAVSHWDASTGQITFSYGDKLAKMKAGDTEIEINGKILRTDVPVTIIEGRTMLPIRMVAENILDKEVFWDPSGMVIIGEQLPEAMDVEAIAQKITQPLQRTVPLYAPTEKELDGAVAAADAVLEKWPDEAYWIENFVPKQAPRKNIQQPLEEYGYEVDWQWDSEKPNEIYEAVSGVTYPNEKYPYTYKEVITKSGKTVSVPYYPVTDEWGDPGYSLVEARIDYEKMNFLETNLAVMANAYYLTKDEKYARRIIVSLDKWADLAGDYFFTKGWNLQHPLSFDEIGNEDNNYKVEWMSDSNGFTNEITAVQVALLDKTFDSPTYEALSQEKGYDVKAHIIDDFYKVKIDYLKNVIPVSVGISSNLPGTYKNAAQLATILHYSEALDWLGEFMRLTIERNFKRDYVYPESFTYHYYYVKDNISLLNTIRNYFELYPEEIDTNWETYESLSQQLALLKKALRIEDVVADPAGNVAPFGDCDAGVALKTNFSVPALLPAYGVAHLAGGEFDRQVALNVGAIDFANHLQEDRNSLQLFAFGKELLGDNKYIRIPGRMYNDSVFAHNTVIVDGQKQGVMKTAKQEYGNSGHIFNGGMFTLFENQTNGVTMSEVYNPYVYGGELDRYQRINLLNMKDEEQPYIIDAFVVEGGSRHEYMLHSSTQFDSQYAADTDLKDVKGHDPQRPLLEEGQIWTEFNGMWDDKDDYYGVFRDVKTAPNADGLKVTFQGSEEGASLNMFVVQSGGAQLYLGNSPAPYRTKRPEEGKFYEYMNPFMLLRKEGNDLKTVYLTVLEPFTEEGQITAVEPVAVDSEDTNHQALRITFADGREDVVLLNLNNAVITGSTDSDKAFSTADGAYSLEGRAAVFSNRFDTVSIAAKSCAKGETVTENPGWKYEGAITAVGSVQNGADANYFETDASIPAGTELRGGWMSVQFGTYQTVNVENLKEQTDLSELYQIDRIETVDGKTRIYLCSDPALKLENGNTVETMRPQRTFEGAPQFILYTSK